MFADRVENLRDYAPPPWLVHLLRRRQVPVPYRAALRAVLALALPLAAGFAIGRPELGAVVSAGGLPMVLADESESYRLRAVRLCSAALTATAGYVVGLLTLAAQVPASPVIVLLAVVSVLVGRVGSATGVAGMLLLVFGVIGAAEHRAELGFGVLLGAFLVGVGWSLIVGLGAWAVRGTAPERDAVAKVFVELAVLLGTDDPALSRASRHQLTVAMNTAYDRLLTARAWMPRRDAAFRSLLTLLSQATPIVEAAVAMVNTRERAPQPVVDHLTRVAAAVLADADLPDPPAGGFDAEGPRLAALLAGLERLEGGRGRAPRGPKPTGVWLRERVGDLRIERDTVNAALRLGLCVTLAEAVSIALPMEHTHWVTLTVAIVLRPELGSIFGRTVLRAIGTCAGVLLGAALLFAGPNGWLLVALAAVLAAGVAIGRVYNYALLSTAITPMIIVQMDIQNLGDPTVLTERLTHTLLGCAIVLIFGYWLWPGSMRPRVGGRVADTLDAVREYVAHSLDSAPSDEERSRARRRAYRALADTRLAFAQVIVEPSAAGRQAVAWWPAIVALERVLDAVTDVVISVRRGADPPERSQVKLVIDAIDELVDAVRDGREPERVRIPHAGPLSTVADHLRTAFDAIRGPVLR